MASFLDDSKIITKPWHKHWWGLPAIIGVVVILAVIIFFLITTFRSEYDSRTQLKKLIGKTLVDTNWRLMSEGVSYKMGFLRGRIKGVEGEENLLALVKDNKKAKGSTITGWL